MGGREVLGESAGPRRRGVLRSNEGDLSVSVWAPFAKSVDLIFEGAKQSDAIALKSLDRGYYEGRMPGNHASRPYKFRLNGEFDVPDPCSLHQPQGVHGFSKPYFPEDFAWTDAGWKGVARHELVFYELHVGTFTPQGTFDAMIDRLGELKSLGVTAIELMPIAQFPGARNWGYDGVLLFAAHSDYGGPAGLQRLVDAAHRHGLAVFLDVVYNHFGPEGNYLSQFGPFFTDRYKTPWGSAVNYDGAGSDGVRQFVLSNARMWLDEFHLDGLRLDAVHAIFDLSAKHILSEIAEVARQVETAQRRQIHIVAESDLNDPRLLLPAERGGYELDAQWADDFHHVAHAHFTQERQGYYADFGPPEQLATAMLRPFVYAGHYSRYRERRHGASPEGLGADRFVVFLQNHDQIGNRALGDRIASTLSPAQLRQVAAWLLLSPYLPLLFMGEEYGETNPFAFFCSFGDSELIEAVRKGRREEFAAFDWQGEVPDPQAVETFESCRLTWQWPAGSAAHGLRRLYQDLLKARRTWPALAGTVRERRCELVTANDQGNIIRLTRFGDQAGDSLDAWFNLDNRPIDLTSFVGSGHALLSTEEDRYGGQRRHLSDLRDLLPHECVVFGPS